MASARDFCSCCRKCGHPVPCDAAIEACRAYGGDVSAAKGDATCDGACSCGVPDATDDEPTARFLAVKWYSEAAEQ